MDIMLQGCSFSWGEGLDFPEQQRYSAILESMADVKIRNIAESSKCNSVSYFELHAILSYIALGKLQKPKILIWQLADNFREGIVDNGASGSWIPGSLGSMVGNYRKRYITCIEWNRYDYITNIVKKLKAKGENKKANWYKQQHGTGTCLVYDDPSLDSDVKNKDVRRWPIGDETFIRNELLTCMHIQTIQKLCKELEIKLVIINYYGIPIDVQKDPIFKQIDTSDFLIKNYTWGLYNHMLWKGFSKPDDFHFGVDGHLYQADIVYDFLYNNTSLEVDEEIFEDNNVPVFDYDIGLSYLKTMTEFGLNNNNKRAKNLLINTQYIKK